MAFYQEHYFGKYVANGFSEEYIFFSDFILFNSLSNMFLKKCRAHGPNLSPKRVKRGIYFRDLGDVVAQWRCGGSIVAHQNAILQFRVRIRHLSNL
jgi:hypothetical protein